MTPRQLRASPALDRSLPTRDPDAVFDALVREHYSKLCRFLHRQVGSEAAAEDLAQDLFLRLWERRESFDFSDPLPYLYRAARNRALSHLRHEGVLRRWRRAAEAAPPPVIYPTEPEVPGLAVAISAAIQGLPERCRLIFLMSREQGLSYQQIATVLGVSIKTVETQMGRALRVLRSKLAPLL